MTPEQQIIWFTGFYEGEGSISNDITNRNAIRIPLEIGKKIWGGSIRVRTRKSPASDKMH
jgi:hypothetical protein